MRTTAVAMRLSKVSGCELKWRLRPRRYDLCTKSRI
jgi:hypothetical protein